MPGPVIVPVPDPPVVVVSVNVGGDAGAGSTLTVRVHVSTIPPLVARTMTSYVPGTVKVCDGVTCVEVPPSRKSQKKSNTPVPPLACAPNFTVKGTGPSRISAWQVSESCPGGSVVVVVTVTT